MIIDDVLWVCGLCNLVIYGTKCCVIAKTLTGKVTVKSIVKNA